MHHRLALAFVVTAACGAPSPSRPVSNLTPDTPPVAPEVAVDPAGPLGVLAFPAAAAPPDDAPHWMARTPAAAVVPVGETVSLATATTYAAIPAGGGKALELVAGARTTIKFGCDGGSDLDVVPLASATPASGALLWVLPSPVPPAWTPSSPALVLEKEARDERVVRAGEVVVAMQRLDATHMQLRVSIGDQVVHEERAEAYFMEGAGTIDLDFTQGRWPGIPTPEAVFAFGATGPYLVVLDRSGYEGVAFATLLVSRNAKARAIESLELGAYYCAF